ncbi:hypothetical protein S83_015556 [Arachis hypogaea]
MQPSSKGKEVMESRNKTTMKNKQDYYWLSLELIKQISNMFDGVFPHSVVVPSSQIYYPTKEKVDMANRIHRNVVKAILATDPPDPGAGMTTISNKTELIFSNNRDDAVNMVVDQNLSGVHT